MKLKIIALMLMVLSSTGCLSPKFNEDNSTNTEVVQNTVLIMEIGYCIINPKSVLCSHDDRNSTHTVAKPLAPVRFTVERVEDINATHKTITIRILGQNNE